MRIESVLQEANRGPGKVVAYADDFTLSIAGPDLETVRLIAQKSISDIFKFGKERGIAFNPGKTEVLHLGKDPEHGASMKELTMNDISIPYAEEVT